MPNNLLIFYQDHLCIELRVSLKDKNYTKKYWPANILIFVRIFNHLAGEDGSIPVNGLCRDGRGICDTGGICVFLDGTFAKADLNRLVQESANEAFQVLANYW